MTETTRPVNVGDLNRTATYVVQEGAWGVDPGAGATYGEVPHVTTNLTGNKPSVTSEVVDSGRRVKDLIFTGLNASGSISTELILEAYDEFYGAVAMGEFVAQAELPAATIISTNITMSGTSIELSRSSGSFVSDGWAVGQWVMPVGFLLGANAVPRKVSAVAALLLTVEGTVALDETKGVQMVRLKTVTDANVFKSYSIYNEWTQFSNRFLHWLGMAVNGSKVTLTPQNKVTTSFDFLGKSQTRVTSAPGTGTPVAAPANRVVSSGSGLKVAMEGGSGAMRLVSQNTEYANGLYAVEQAGQIGPITMGLGTKSAKGDFVTYVTDTTGLELLDKWENETETSLAYVFGDPNGNFMVLDHPRVLLETAEAPFAGSNAASEVSCSWQALPYVEGAVTFLWRMAFYTAP